MYFKVGISILVLLQITTYVQSTVSNIGCHKLSNQPIGCHLETRDAERAFTNKIQISMANAVEWLRREQKSNGIWFSLQASSWVLQSLVLAGYVNDERICTKTIYEAKSALQSASNVEEISAGSLAMIMIGMRATCNDVTNFQGKNLVERLMEKMSEYPIDDFNNYYQYSLGVIALYVNGKALSSEYGEKILSELEKIPADSKYMSDTEALSLIALSAMSRKKSLPKSVLDKVEQLLQKGESKIDRIMAETALENSVTVTHLLQVLQSRNIGLSSKPYCKKALDWILKGQEQSGSFEGLMPTATILPMLSGRSILELRNKKCPTEKDDVDSVKIKDFIVSRKPIKPTGSPPPATQIKVTVDVQSKVTGEVFGTDNVTISLPSGTTALEALKEASKLDECFRSRVKATAWGPSIEMICNVENNHIKKAYWMFYVNGKMASVGPGSYKLINGDYVSFKYVAFSF